MSDAAEKLALALGHSLAAGARVLLVGDDFEALQLIAGAAVSELVIVTALADPGAPAGETATGAPLRMRPDWAERRSSKDLIIDPAGTASAEEVLRILKKKGVYLTARADGAIADLEHVTEVPSSQVSALVAGAGVGPLVPLAAGVPGPSVYLAGKSGPVAEATAAVTIDAVPVEAPAPAPDPEQTEALESARIALEAQAEAIAELQVEAERLPELEAQLKAAKTELKAQAALAANAAKLEAELVKARAEQSELETDYERVRDELATQRVDAQRMQRVEDRFEAARAQMSAEVARLKARLLAIDEDGADIEALRADRDAARAVAHGLSEALGDALTKLAGWSVPGNPPPLISPEALEPWLAQVAKTIDAAVPQAVAQETAPVTPPALPPLPEWAPFEPPSPATPSETEARIAALEAALDAERTLRASDLARIERAEAYAAQFSSREAALREAAQTRSQAASRAMIAQYQAEEATRRLRAELDLRAQREAELMGILSAHGEMQQLLAHELTRAEDARDEAEQHRRLVTENLRILRAEFEREQG